MAIFFYSQQEDGRNATLDCHALKIAELDLLFRGWLPLPWSTALQSIKEYQEAMHRDVLQAFSSLLQTK